MTSTPPTPSNSPPHGTLRQWMRDHDESWVFVVLYLGLAVGLSVLVSLFWLVLMAFLHLLLELYRQQHYRRSRSGVFLHALWEVKLDVGLVLLALTLVLYIDVVLGILGIQSAARAAAVTHASARIGTRAAAWERTLRTFLLTVDEMVRVGHATLLFRKRRMGRIKVGVNPEVTGPESSRENAPRAPSKDAPKDPAWSGPWGWGDRIGVSLIVAGLALMVLTPVLTPLDWSTSADLLRGELRPFPR